MPIRPSIEQYEIYHIEETTTYYYIIIVIMACFCAYTSVYVPTNITHVPTITISTYCRLFDFYNPAVCMCMLCVLYKAKADCIGKM